MLTVLIVIASTYTVLLVAVFFLQRQLLFFPDGRRLTEAELGAAGLRFWPSENDFRGYTSAVLSQNLKGVVIVFHGNAGTAFDRYHYIESLKPLGYQVILAEYPGYGGRDGELSEGSFTADARESVRLVREQFSGPLYLCGESLGCGVAAATAATDVEVDGIILITPWDTLSALAQKKFWYVPARYIVRDKFNSVSNLICFEKPVALAIARQDQTIPPAHGLRLYESLNGRKHLWEFIDAGHNTWPQKTNPHWWREIMNFIAGTEDQGADYHFQGESEYLSAENVADD